MSNKKHDGNFESFLEGIATVLPFCAIPPDDDAVGCFAPVLRAAGVDDPAFFKQCADEEEFPTMKFVELFNSQRSRSLGNSIADTLIEFNESTEVGIVENSDMYYTMNYGEKTYVVQHHTDILFGNKRPTKLIDYFHNKGLFADNNIDGFVVIKNNVFVTLSDEVDNVVQEVGSDDTLLDYERFLMTSALTRKRAATMVFYTVLSLSSANALLRLIIPDAHEGIECDLETFQASSIQRIEYLATKLNVKVDNNFIRKLCFTVH